jgi:hypothetical protein
MSDPLPQIEVSSEVNNQPDELSLLKKSRELRRSVARSWVQMMESMEDIEQLEKELNMLSGDIEYLQQVDGQIHRLLTDQDLDVDMEESNKLLCQLQNFKNNCLTFLDHQPAPENDYYSDCSDDEYII